jgi:hypothetical protein
MHRRWLALARDVVGWSMRGAEQRGAPLRLTLGLDDLIFSTSRLILAAQLWFHRWQPVDYLRSFPDGYTVASYRRQLLSPQPANVLITGDRRGAPITREKRRRPRARSDSSRQLLHDARREEDSNLVARTAPELMRDAEAGGTLAL